MIASIIMIALAFAWLMYETDYLRVRLPVGIVSRPALTEDDWQYLIGDDGGDSDEPADITTYLNDKEMADSHQYQLEETIKYHENEKVYHEWLDKRYETKLVYGTVITHQVDPRYRWMVIEDDLRRRRSGNCIYQRGSSLWNDKN